MAGSSITLTSRVRKEIGRGATSKSVEIITVDWVADDTDGSVPTLSLDLYGWAIKANTVPGATNPTDDYDITLGDPLSSSLDAFAAQLLNRDASTPEVIYLKQVNAFPLLFAGTYQLQITNNAVNSATGKIELWMMDTL